MSENELIRFWFKEGCVTLLCVILYMMSLPLDSSLMLC